MRLLPCIQTMLEEDLASQVREGDDELAGGVRYLWHHVGGGQLARDVWLE